MWRQPKIHTIKAPPDCMKIIENGIYWNQKGNFEGSTLRYKLNYIFSYIIIWLLFVIPTLYFVIKLNSVIFLYIMVFVYIATLISIAIWIYYWGWLEYREIWYLFNDKEQIFYATFEGKNGWELFEIPYEDIHEIEWIDGPNGKAFIHFSNMKFETNRALDKRRSSVTELWPTLARISGIDKHNIMTNWPIYLECPNCNRVYGHHIGTAQCPFDDYILIEPGVKGRIDPEDIHPEDLDRV